MYTNNIIGEGNGNPLWYSCLGNPMDGGAWWATVHGVVKSQTWLSDFTFTFHFDALEKEMAAHSSIPAWRIPRTEEPGGLPPMGLHGVGHNWRDLAVAAITLFKQQQQEKSTGNRITQSICRKKIMTNIGSLYPGLPMTEWIRIHVAMQGTWVWSLVWEESTWSN